MSTGWIKPTPLSSDRLIDINDFPIGLIDVELSMPPTELVNDTAAVLLRAEHGPPTAVLRVARGLLGGAELRKQRSVLAELAVQPRLDDEWRELLPRILAFDERANATLSVESYRPGMDLAEVLARRPDLVGELTAAALSAIAPLHRGTATFVVPDNLCLLRRWIIEPLEELTAMCRQLDPLMVSEVDRLGPMLRRALVDRRISVSWTHGGYVPGNVRLAGVRGPVTGIVDWGAAGPGQPTLIDEYLMILTASCQVERADLGKLIAERLRAGGLSDGERNALHAAHDRSDAEICDHERIDERLAILLTWLHQAADSWRKRATHPNHYVWWATNVAPVIDVVSSWQRLDGSSGRAGAGRGTAAGAPMTTTPRLGGVSRNPGNQVTG